MSMMAHTYYHLVQAHARKQKQEIWLCTEVITGEKKKTKACKMSCLF
jgi:hypothetical protein